MASLSASLTILVELSFPFFQPSMKSGSGSKVCGAIWWSSLRQYGGLDYQEDLSVGGGESLVELGVNEPRVEEDLEAVPGRVDSENQRTGRRSSPS